MFKLNEPTIKAIHTRLVTRLPDWIDRVNAELEDPDVLIVCPESEMILDYIPTTASLQSFPAVAVGDGPIDFEDDTGWSATGVMDFNIVVWVQEYDQRTLAWKLRRTMIAVANCILENRTLNAEGGGWGMVLRNIEPGPTLGRKENPREIVGMRAMRITVRDEQDA